MQVQTEANTNQVTAQSKKQREFYNANGERLMTLPMVLERTGVKARATIDAYIREGHLQFVKSRGRQPATRRGRRYLFTEAAVAKLERYMLSHGRIVPKAFRGQVEKVVQKPAEAKASHTSTKSVEVKKTRKAVSKKSDILAALAVALDKVDALTEIVQSLANDVRRETSGSDTTH